MNRLYVFFRYCPHFDETPFIIVKILGKRFLAWHFYFSMAELKKCLKRSQKIENFQKRSEMAK